MIALLGGYYRATGSRSKYYRLHKCVSRCSAYENKPDRKHESLRAPQKHQLRKLLLGHPWAQVEVGAAAEVVKCKVLVSAGCGPVEVIRVVVRGLDGRGGGCVFAIAASVAVDVDCRATASFGAFVSARCWPVEVIRVVGRGSDSRCSPCLFAIAASVAIGVDFRAISGWSLELGVWSQQLRVWSLEFGVSSLEFGVSDLEFRVSGLELGAWALGSAAWSLESAAWSLELPPSLSTSTAEPLSPSGQSYPLGAGLSCRTLASCLAIPHAGASRASRAEPDGRSSAVQDTPILVY
jgi:hypothetical protein